MTKAHRIQAVCAALLIAASMTACSAKSENYSDDSYYYESEANYSELSKDEITDYSQSGTGSENGNGTEQYEDKIIRTADVYMESDDAQKCYDTLKKFAEDNGGREMNVSKNSDAYDDYSRITIIATLKINPDKLEEFIELAEKTDTVTSSSISSDDVTAEYYDIKIRLESKKKALENYYKLLEEAKTLQESLAIQQYITDLTAEIESMEGRLKYYDAKVDLSTIELTIVQSDKLPSVVEDNFEWYSLSFSDVLTLIKNGFLTVVNFLWSLLLWIIIIAAALSPILAIAGIVIFVVRRYRKKHPKPKAAYPTINYGYVAPQNIQNVQNTENKYHAPNESVNKPTNDSQGK
ncbi:MAG: DUF4349 domain-containing protein [Acutalibacteraceae bacterium]